MDGVIITHDLIELEMFSSDNGTVIDLCDGYNKYMTIIVSNDELIKIRDYINSVVGI